MCNRQERRSQLGPTPGHNNHTRGGSSKARRFSQKTTTRATQPSLRDMSQCSAKTESLLKLLWTRPSLAFRCAAQTKNSQADELLSLRPGGCRGVVESEPGCLRGARSTSGLWLQIKGSKCHPNARGDRRRHFCRGPSFAGGIVESWWSHGAVGCSGGTHEGDGGRMLKENGEDFRMHKWSIASISAFVNSIRTFRSTNTKEQLARLGEGTLQNLVVPLTGNFFAERVAKVGAEEAHLSESIVVMSMNPPAHGGSMSGTVFSAANTWRGLWKGL